MKLFNKIRDFTGYIPLRIKIWLYFIAFTLIVFILLWIFQILFLEKFYEGMKIRDVENAATSLVESFDSMNSNDFNEALTRIAVDNDLCIDVLDKFGRSFSSREILGDCLIHGRGNNVHAYIQNIANSTNGWVYYKIRNPRSNYDMLLYGCVLGNVNNPKGFLLINSALVPVGSTVSIIKRQLMSITAILIFIAFALSLWVSNKIARPIDRITKSAEGLAEGNLAIQFDGHGYLETKKLADTLNYAEKELSRVERMQRDLMANVSHDLRTPLTMLKAYAEMIRDLSGDNPKKRAEHLDIIINETDRLALLVNDILDLSKLESGKQKLDCSEFDIRSKMNEIIDRFKGVSEKMGYNIHFTPDKEYMVCCDVLKIEQVIYNLINNAINYTGADKQVFVRQINQADGVLIEVEDTGDGIEEDKIKLIFDKYYRSENHKREVVGTGLGLSIVKAVLKLHGFDYGVRSILGKGSVFWFRINNNNAKEMVVKNKQNNQ